MAQDVEKGSPEQKASFHKLCFTIPKRCLLNSNINFAASAALNASHHRTAKPQGASCPNAKTYISSLSSCGEAAGDDGDGDGDEDIDDDGGVRQEVEA